MLTTGERIKSIDGLKSRARRFPEEISQKARAIIGVSQRIEQIKLNDYFIPAIKALRGHESQDKANGKRHFSYLVLKPVGPRCNLHCSYCYHGNIKKFKFKRYSYLKENTVMNESLLERITQQAVKFLYGKLEFDWHGGEPLMAGLDFYKMAIRIQKKYQREGIVLKNCIQTNATLINDEWIRFFKENDFSIGLSLDGTRTNHDLHRVYPSGRGSYDDIVKNLKKLKKAGIKYGAISVITPLHEKNPRRLIESFIEADITSVKIHPSNHPDLRFSPEEYADYMIDIFEAWLSEYATKISISLFQEIFHVLLGLHLPNCHGKCGRTLLSFEPNGDVWLCDWPFGCEDYRFGNIMDTDLEGILKSEKYLGFLERRSRLTDSCSSCQWYQFCYGGCTYFRTLKTGKIEDENYYCNGMKRIFEHVTKRFDQILEENEKKDSISRQRVPVEA